MRKNKKSPPQTVKFTENERLTMENLELRLAGVMAEAGRLRQEKEDLGERIRKKYGIDDLRRYMIDGASGVAKRVDSKQQTQA